jgi:hypothetical protein
MFGGDDGKGLDKGLCGLYGAVDDIARLIDGIVHLPLRSFDCLLRFFAETLCLRFQVVSRIFKIISSFLYPSAKLFSSSDPGLRSVEKGDGGTCADADAESEPIILCAHEKYLVLDLLLCSCT